MNQWLANLSPFEVYLIAVPSIMLGSILFLGGIIRLLEHRNGDDPAEAFWKEGGMHEDLT